jgi:hypothetical protein
MPQLIKKNGKYFLRKPYDFAVHPDAIDMLKNVKNGSNIDEGFYKNLLRQGYIEFYHSQFRKKSIDNESNANTESDTLGELLNSIREIEQRFSSYGIEIEVKIKSASAQ